MAGSLTTPVHHRGNTAASEFSRWLIGFARFIPFPSSPSTHHPALIPLGKRELSPPPHGTWLSTSCSTVSLQMIDEVNRSDAILSASLDGKILEEHYISNLNFSWPHMTCVSGFPSRGGRAILVSYKDSENEIQKFALRFSTCDAAETFVVALKEKFKGLEEVGIQRSVTVRSKISFQSDYNSTSTEIFPSATMEEPNMVEPLESYVPEMVPRLEATMEEPNMVEPLESYVPEMVPRLEYETEQTLYRPQPAPSQIPNESSINLPPTFTTLLSTCFPNSTLAAGQTVVKQDPELKSQILKYMEDSAFQDMLQRVETIIDEIGGLLSQSLKPGKAGKKRKYGGLNSRMKKKQKHSASTSLTKSIPANQIEKTKKCPIDVWWDWENAGIPYNLHPKEVYGRFLKKLGEEGFTGSLAMETVSSGHLPTSSTDLRRSEEVRRQVVQQLEENRHMYEGFVLDYEEYCETMAKLGEWGDHITLQAAADRFAVEIHLLTSSEQNGLIEIVPREEVHRRGDLWLSYWSEGEHYNSLYDI